MITKREFRKTHRQDRDKLFNAAWRDIVNFAKNRNIDDIDALYEEIVSSKVNNPRSQFYIYG